MKIGISISIDVTKIDKARIFEGKKGKYIDLTTFVDLDQVDQYDNNGFISQTVSKDERASGVKTPILGNCKVFFNDSQQGQRQDSRGNSGEFQGRQAPQQTPGSGFDNSPTANDFDDMDSIPF